MTEGCPFCSEVRACHASEAGGGRSAGFFCCAQGEPAAEAPKDRFAALHPVTLIARPQRIRPEAAGRQAKPSPNAAPPNRSFASCAASKHKLGYPCCGHSAARPRPMMVYSDFSILQVLQIVRRAPSRLSVLSAALLPTCSFVSRLFVRFATALLQNSGLLGFTLRIHVVRRVA